MILVTVQRRTMRGQLAQGVSAEIENPCMVKFTRPAWNRQRSMRLLRGESMTAALIDSMFNREVVRVGGKPPEWIGRAKPHKSTRIFRQVFRFRFIRRKPRLDVSGDVDEVQQRRLLGWRKG